MILKNNYNKVIILFLIIIIIYLLFKEINKNKYLTILSWNVEWFGYSKRKNASDELNKTENEKLIDNLIQVKNILYEMRPDIICLQEVSSVPIIKKLHEYLPNYDLYYPKSIEDNKNTDFLQFNIFFVRKFIKVNEFREFNKKQIYLNFIDPINKETIHLFNIHLRSDFKRFSSDVRQKQVKEILNNIKQVNNSDENTIICGDFNAEIGSPELKILNDYNFINILISRKNDLPSLKTNSIWMDKDNNNIINKDELKMIDYFFTNYKFYKKVTNSFIKFIFYQKIHKNDILLKISDHYPIILFFEKF